MGDAGESASELLVRLAPQGITISMITYGEVYEGTLHGDDPARDQAGFERFLDAVAVLPMDHAVMRRYSRLRSDFARRGLNIVDAELLLAATALHYDLTLVVTEGRWHFEQIADLRLHDG